ncbi:MAG: N-acetyltransferase, partial [Clostridia bacterium]
SCVFTNVINPRSHINRKDEYRKTIIGRGASLGANCTIVCGHNVGKYALVGAGSVVTKDVNDYTIVYGNPAVMKGYVCNCGEKIVFINDKAECDVCHRKYIRNKTKIEEI